MQDYRLVLLMLDETDLSDEEAVLEPAKKIDLPGSWYMGGFAVILSL